MATLHISGTQLSQPPTRLPLNKAFLTALAFTFLIAMHFPMKNPGGSGLDLTFNHTTWIGISFTIAVGLYQMTIKQTIRYTKLTGGLFVSCLLLTAPVLFQASDLTLVSQRLIGLWAGFFFFLTLQQFKFSNRQKQQLLWLIVLASLIEAAFGYTQYLLLEPDNLFGYDVVANRPYGIFQQPNVMASFLATGLVVSGYLLTRTPHKYQRRLSSVGLLYATPLIVLPLLIALGSRTGWIASFIAVCLLLPYVYRYSSTKRFSGWCSALVFGIILGFSITQAADKTEFISAKADLESPRQYTLPQAVDMFIEKPFTGYGYGKFEAEYILYTARQHQLNPNYPAGLPTMDHPHNEALFWGVEGGLIPIIGILLAAILVLSHMYSANKGTRLAMLALMVPILLHTQLEFPFYHSAIHWFTFILLIYWVDQRTANYHESSYSRFSKMGLRVASLTLPILTSIYMLTALHTNYVLMQFETAKTKNPDVLENVTNIHAWQQRYDWDIYSTYLRLGLIRNDPSLIQPYVDWSLSIIEQKPRPALYKNLVWAYQGLGEETKAVQVQTEAHYLFPKSGFNNIVLNSEDSQQ